MSPSPSVDCAPLGTDDWAQESDAAVQMTIPSASRSTRWWEDGEDRFDIVEKSL